MLLESKGTRLLFVKFSKKTQRIRNGTSNGQATSKKGAVLTLDQLLGRKGWARVVDCSPDGKNMGLGGWADKGRHSGR